MRLPFPERIPLTPVLFAATVLTGLQQLQGTSLAFSLYTFLFIVIATVAFNHAGGFSRPTGSYVFFYSVLGLLIGLFYKAYLGERADSNLRSPILTMQVFTGGITAMLAAVVISRKFTRKRPFLSPNLLRDKDLKNAAVGCFVFGLFLNLATSILPHQSGSVLSAVAQLNRFLQMAIIIGTLHAVRKSGGRRGFDIPVIIYITVGSLFGVISFSKEGMFTPAMCWLVAAASARLNVRLYQVAIGLVLVFGVFHFLVPYSQYGRTQVPEDATLEQRVEISYAMFTDLNSVREIYLEGYDDSNNEEGTSLNYYDKPQGFFDRLTMIGPDDALIHYTSLGYYTGLDVIAAYFANWVPHFLWPNKPSFGAGNFFAHKIGGILAEDDLSTGISFTPTGEAYQLAGWVGVFIVAPVIWIMLFTLLDSVCGDTRKSPWGLLVIALYAHAAPEAMLAGSVYIMWFGTIGVLFVALLTSYIMPLLGTLLVGPEKTGLIRIRRNRTPVIPPPRRKPARSTA